MAKRKATAGQILINEVLPEDMRDYNRTLDKKGLSKLLTEVAQKHPDDYRDISHRLGKIGREAAFTSGGNSFGLAHMKRALVARKMQSGLKTRINALLDNDSLDDDARDAAIIKLVGKAMPQLQDAILEESDAEGNPLAQQLKGAGRGNKMNLSSLRGSDGLYQDHRDNIIPIPVLKSYSEGLSPLEYWGGTYGARQGVMAVKFATQDAGFLCLAEGTEVRMADWSTKPIEEIQVGDTVLGANKYGTTFPVKVTATFDNGVRQLTKFRFRYGKARNRFIEVTATDKHKALAEHLRRRRKRPDPRLHIEISQDVMPMGTFERRTVSRHALVPPQGYSCPQTGPRDEYCWLLGLLTAEGGLTTNHVGLSCGDPELLKEARRLTKPMGFEIRQKKNAQYEYSFYDTQPLPAKGKPGGGIATGSFRNRLKAKLAEHGLLGKLAQDKELPEQIWAWPNSHVCGFLRWLFAGDGGVSPSNNATLPVVTLGMTAEPVVRGVERLLADRFGIYGQISMDKAENCPKANHDCHVLAISDPQSVERFAQHIGFVAGSKQARLMTLLAEADPCERHSRFLFHYLDSEDVGEGPTYDIEVDNEDHLFVLANGAIVSNSKQLNQIAHRSVVIDEDSDGEPDTLIGLPVDTDDMDSEGSLLAAPAGKYKRNTVLTPKIIRELKQAGIKRLLVRSPAIGGTPDGGVYGRDVGIREFGRLPTRGENVGLTAAQALSEPLSQAQLSAKHTGGVAGESQAVSGFDYINQLVQVPKTFKGGAAHSTLDGIVQAVEPAPAGGTYVSINGERHYIAGGFEPKVKKGDHVEAGDVISDGTPNPSLITKHKGVGEGRRYYIKSFADAMSSAGIKSHRRNVELLARGLINHVRLTDEIGDFAPDDVVPYSMMAARYIPREGFKTMDPNRATGKYLERPYLHYSIGTKIRPSMMKDFKDFGVKSVDVHDDEPPFEPEMIRGMANLQHDPDWMTRMFGSGLKGSLLRGVHRGGTSSETGTSFVAGRAKAVDFGRTGIIQTPKEPPKP